MNVFVNGNGARVDPDLAHHDIVAVVAGEIISRGGLARLVRFKFLMRTKGNDADRQRRSALRLRHFDEKTSNLFEVLQRAFGGAFAGAREHLEVRAGGLDPPRSGIAGSSGKQQGQGAPAAAQQSAAFYRIGQNPANRERLHYFTYYATPDYVTQCYRRRFPSEMQQLPLTATPE